MRIVSGGRLREFTRRHADARKAIRDWQDGVRRAEWVAPHDVLSGRWKPRLVGEDRVIFRIQGNAYRIIVRVDYGSRTVFVRFAGTHSEYDKVNARTI